MIITKKALARRTVLRGMGAALGLPLLDGMMPALSAAAKATVRFGALYAPNGMIMEQWTPATEGAGFEFTPTLKPLESFRDKLLLISGLDNTGSNSRGLGNSGPHSRHGAAFLTGSEAVPTPGSTRLEVGVSMDQVAAKTIGQQTRLPSLELGMENEQTSSGVGTCEPSYSCTYAATISWLNANTPMPVEPNPRTVFERLFGDLGTTDSAILRARGQREQSILDSVMADIARLQQGLGSGDRVRLNEYLTAVREIERRIQVAEQQATKELPLVESPAGIPVSYSEHAALLYDLQVLALQCDLTRIFTFQIGREQSGQTYPQVGVSEGHHPISHHGNNPEKMANVAKINAYHVSLFARFVEKLESISDGDGTLLDHSMLLYGAGMSDSQSHKNFNIPLLIAGSGAGQIKTGRHIRYAKGTKLSNLELALLHTLGVPAETLGDGTEPLGGLT